ncbi:MAG: hypothetical protein R3B99_03605 [Polyangiales bacterium]
MDAEMVKLLNLLDLYPYRVLRETERGKLDVLSPDSVPAGWGVCWVAGVCVLASGRRMPAAFRLDTDAGASLLTVFFKSEMGWVEQGDPDFLRMLGMTSAEVFPYDWRYSVTIEEDMYGRG